MREAGAIEGCCARKIVLPPTPSCLLVAERRVKHQAGLEEVRGDFASRARHRRSRRHPSMNLYAGYLHPKPGRCFLSKRPLSCPGLLRLPPPPPPAAKCLGIARNLPSAALGTTTTFPREPMQGCPATATRPHALATSTVGRAYGGSWYNERSQQPQGRGQRREELGGLSLCAAGVGCPGVG